MAPLRIKIETELKELRDEQTKERLKKIALFVIPGVLGAVAVKNIYKNGQTRHVSYWDASRSFFIDLLNDSKDATIRITGEVIRGQNDTQVQDVELDERQYTSEELKILEDGFLTEEFNPR